MKNRIIIVLIALCMFMLDSCRVQGPALTTRRFQIPAYRSRHHWGAPRHTSLRSRYWGQKRYGPRPNKYRGRFRE